MLLKFLIWAMLVYEDSKSPQPDSHATIEQYASATVTNSFVVDQKHTPVIPVTPVVLPDASKTVKQHTPAALPEPFKVAEQATVADSIVADEQRTPVTLQDSSKTIKQQMPATLSKPVVVIEQRRIVTHIAALVQPSTVTVASTTTTVTSTVTATVGIIATPIKQDTADAPFLYPTAMPGVIAQYDDDYTPESTLLNTPLPYHDAIVASGYWFTDAGFDIDFRITPLRLIMAALLYGCMQLAFMIHYRDYNLFNKAVMSLFRGLYTGSQVLWTLLLAGGMYLTYDQLRENPASIAHSEMMSLFGDNPGVVAIRLLVFLKKLAGYDPITDRNQPGWTHFHENYLRQQDGSFTPKTVEELFVGGLVALFRLACVVFRFCLPFLLDLRDWINRHNLVTNVGNFLKWLLEFLLIGLPVLAVVMLYRVLIGLKDYTLAGCYFLRLAMWTLIQNPCPCKGRVPWERDPYSAGNNKQRLALQELARMSIWDMADLVMERDGLLNQLANLESTLRKQLGKDVEHITKALGQRAMSWRTSHTELLKDYNHCRTTLDYVMSRFLCEIFNINPEGPSARPFFRSAYLISTPEPLSNGLHYKPSDYYSRGHVTFNEYDKCSNSLLHVLRMAKKGVGFHSGWLPLSMDLYDERTWGFDLKRIGFEFASYKPESNPIDLKKRLAQPCKLQEMEDYAVEGRMLQWYEDEPARLAKKRRLQHPFLHSRNDI